MIRRRASTPREPIRATTAELAAVGIDYRSGDLFTGYSSPDDQLPVYFGLARLTKSNQAFWRHYRSSSGRVADILARLAAALRRPDERLDFDELAASYGWSRKAFAGVADAIRRRDYAARKIFRSVKGGVIGFEWLLDGDFARTEDRFVAYASKEPIRTDPDITRHDRTVEPSAQLREHEARYSELLLTVGVATERGLPTVTHFGMFRNPLAFLDLEPAHRGLAMQLHGFAATVSLHALSDKHYMVTNPMPEMTRILRRALAPEDVYVGDSDADVRRYLERDLPSGAPPIREDQRYSYAGFTLNARPTVARLKALARCYRPTEPVPGRERALTQSSGS